MYVEQNIYILGTSTSRGAETKRQPGLLNACRNRHGIAMWSTHLARQYTFRCNNTTCMLNKPI